MAAIVVKVMGDFIPEVFENLMFLDVISICLRRLGGPNFFTQGGKTIEFTMVVTTMQRMSHSARSLRPPPDIALECVC